MNSKILVLNAGKDVVNRTECVPGAAQKRTPIMPGLIVEMDVPFQVENIPSSLNLDSNIVFHIF